MLNVFNQCSDKNKKRINCDLSFLGKKISTFESQQRISTREYQYLPSIIAEQHHGMPSEIL